MERKHLIMAAGLMLLPCLAQAQLSSNKDKFLGNITTGYNVDYGNEKYYTLWNQITPENESKWGSIEGSSRGSFNWGSDNAYNYAKNHKFPFKFHCLIWGAQYPSWMNNLNTSEQYKAIVEWMDAIKAHYPQLDMIDVVNEAVPGHQPAPYKAALGGDGRTGYDWIIRAFELAHERWPDAILIYNDYNTFQWQRSQFIDLVRTLRDAGAPIDAYGCQSHDLTDMNVNDFKNAMTEIQNALKMPMYSSEYDIGTSDDALQLQRYKEQIPYMWEADYCAGITLWGYIYGHTWTTDGNSGIIRDGKDRPAMAWLREYMKTDAAKNAKSPFPGMVKEASVYVKPTALKVSVNEPMKITVNARLRTRTIDHVDLYINNRLDTTFTAGPYVLEYTPAKLGKYDLKAVVTATDGSTYERLSGFTAVTPRSPFKGEIAIPGTIQAENFDKGSDGISYHDSDSNREGYTSYRTDGGIDIVTGNGGYAVGYTSTGEWMEYTVNVQEAGMYEFDAYVSSGVTNSSFSLSLSTEDSQKDLTTPMAVPCVQSGNYENYRAVHGRLSAKLQAGPQVIRINVTGGGCNIDRIELRRLTISTDIKAPITVTPSSVTAGETCTISVAAAKANDSITKVNVYINNVLYKTMDKAPFQFDYKPSAKGEYLINAEAYVSSGKVSALTKYTLSVANKRSTYGPVAIAIPGTIQAERFDKGGEGLTFHDSDSKNEGDSEFRTDGEGVDLVLGNSGTVIGYTSVGEWLEYSVNVKTAGAYEYIATVSSGVTGSGFSIGLVENGSVTALATVSVPQTGSNDWNTYQTVTGKLNRQLQEGKQILRFTITGAQCNIDKVQFKCTVPAGIARLEEEDSKPDTYYNLQGQRVFNGTRGIVIRDGKKYLVP
ncbi:MAG: endo-1,4-beta-xylanase [Bacteroidaceae bacterium]|nr:endo-1,4-beta-xylanase [Bacteroidaceae bacterium]